MKILVTGGCGFIGSNLVRFLLKQPETTVVNVDKLTYAGNPQSLSDVADAENYHFVRVDIGDRQVIQNLFGEHAFDAVMHLAAESHVDRSIDGPSEFIQTNIVGTFNLLDVSLAYWRKLESHRKEAFRFLHVSTDEVFGSLGETGKFTESSPYDPHSPYAASKAASDHLVRAWHDTYGLPVLITNCSNNYGPFQFPEKLIPLVIGRALKSEPIPVYGDGSNVRDWLYVEDHIHALWTVLRSGSPGQTYNVGGNNEIQNIELVRELCQILNELYPIASDQKSNNALPAGCSESITSYSDLITHVEDRPGHDLRYAIDCSKIERELNWRPTTDWRSGLRKTVQWYLDNQQWSRDITENKYQLERLGTSVE